MPKQFLKPVFTIGSYKIIFFSRESRKLTGWYPPQFVTLIELGDKLFFASRIGIGSERLILHPERCVMQLRRREYSEYIEYKLGEHRHYELLPPVIINGIPHFQILPYNENQGA